MNLKPVFIYKDINGETGYFCITKSCSDSFFKGNFKPEIVGQACLHKKFTFIRYISSMDFDKSKEDFKKDYGIEFDEVQNLWKDSKDIDKNK